MSGNRPLFTALMTGLVLAVVGLHSPVAAEGLQLLPNGPEQLLPDGTVGVVLAPNLDELADDVRSVVALFDAEKADEIDIIQLLERNMKDVADLFDTSGPAILAVSLPPGGPAAPGFTFVGQLSDPNLSAAELVERSGMAAAHVAEGFAALSTNPAYQPSPEPQTILHDMPAGDLSARLDLEAVVATFGPMLQAMIGMGMAGAAADTTRDFQLDSQQQGAAVELIGKVLESAKTLDLSVDYNGEELVLRSNFETLRGSVLAPGEQPPFGNALELARLLPRDHTVFSATAMNLDSLLDFYREAMGLFTSMAEADLPGGVADFYGELMSKFSEGLELWTLPSATSAGFNRGTPEMAGVHRGEAIAAYCDDLLSFVEDLSASTESFGIERSEFETPGGWEAERVDVSIDFSDAIDDSDPDTAMVIAIVQSLIPTIYIAHRDDLTMWMATSNSEDFLDFLAGVDQDTWPKLPPSLEAAAEWAGEGTQSLTTMEIRGLLNSAFDLVRAFMDIPIEDNPPVRVDAAMRIHDSSYQGALRVDLDDAATLIKELIEVFQRFDESQAEEEETEEASLAPDPGERPTNSISLEEAAEMAASLQPAIEEMRGHFFGRDIPVAVVSDAEARDHFLSRLDSELPEGQLDQLARVYADLGMYGEDDDLLDDVLSLLEEQAGGYYDPKNKAFFMLDDMPRAAAPVIMAHELTHALDDHVFDLERYFDDVANNYDAMTARGCVIEGSGMATMTTWLTRAIMQGRLDQEALQAFGETQAGQAERLKQAAPVIANSLVAPYVLGQRFLGRGNMMAAVSGIDAEDIDRAFRDPPQSTEQILHPEKYWGPEIDTPRRVQLPELDGRLPKGFSRDSEGVLGELDLATLTGYRIDLDGGGLLAAEPSTAAASGWDGDRFVIYRHGDRSLTTLAIVFDRDADAQEFVDSVELPLGSMIQARGDRVAMVCGDTEGVDEQLADYLLEEMRVED